MANIAKWRLFPNDQIEEIVKNARSFREVAQKLGYNKDSGSAITSMHNMCKELNLDTSHFLG
jgi:hypothetical protein